jgi:hypothetical protein
MNAVDKVTATGCYNTARLFTKEEEVAELENELAARINAK